MFLILGALRNFNLGMTTLRKGEWNKGVPLGHDPQGKVLGILGMGGIGRNLRDKAKAFGMEIIYHSRNRIVSGKEEGDAEYVSFDELLARSDVLSINCPLNVRLPAPVSFLLPLLTLTYSKKPEV
jgi:glyoxylate reductase